MLICLSLGGTHLQVGLMHSGNYYARPTVLWRERIETARAQSAADLVVTACTEARALILAEGINYREPMRLGLSFPGPFHNRKWFSNNLTDDFQSGVDLVSLTKQVFSNCGFDIVKIDCVLDAQADAGAEVFHPAGSLVGEHIGRATVLNFATGVAAGLVSPKDAKVSGRVLTTERDFTLHFGEGFDGGVGQIGRHLLFEVASGSWNYLFQRDGRTSEQRGAIRLSEYLSGPGITSRYILAFANEYKECLETLMLDRQTQLDIESLLTQEPNLDVLIPKLNKIIRYHGGTVVRRALEKISEFTQSSDSRKKLLVTHLFEEIVQNYEDILLVLNEVDNWKPFLSSVVITGGVGQNIFNIRNFDLVTELSNRLGANISIKRSSLNDSCDRVCHYYFGKFSQSG